MSALRLAGGALLLVSACFDPKFTTETLCGPNGACPSGWACNSADHCELTDTGSSGSPGNPDSGGGDGSADPNCLGNANFIQVCIDASIQPVVVTGTIDTTDGSSSPCISTMPVVDACVILVAETPILNVTVTGDRPLILASRGSLTVSGTLDAGSSRDPTATGPGADAGPCSSDGKAPTGSIAGGGGWGGSFGAAGGAGGSGSAGADEPGGQAPSPVAVDGMLRGGCSGGSGSGDGEMAPAGEFGHGGGAVLLIANGVLTIDGTVNASGSGGGNGQKFGGAGGGGGSGGMIVLDAGAVVKVTANGQCFANGGGGGGSATNQASGTPGLESIAAGTPGAGGSGADHALGGDGGSGGFRTAPGGAQGSNAVMKSTNGSGGGGGGGSVGVIKVFATSQTFLSTQMSPAPS